MSHSGRASSNTEYCTRYCCARCLRPLVCVVSLFCGMFSVAGLTSDSTGNKVSLDETLFCEPTLSYFCSNIHIGCAGQSTLRTWPFTISMIGNKGKMAPAIEQSTLIKAVRDGDIVRADDLDSLILFLKPGKDYVKVSTTGKFNFRHYTQRGALMTYGWCSVEGAAGEIAD